MKTTLDTALTRWAVVCVLWHNFSSTFPLLGAFLAGWFSRDMNLPIETGAFSEFRDSYRKGWAECDSALAIMALQEPLPPASETPL